jgi:uncharacterized protein (TIGR02996 family)
MTEAQLVAAVSAAPEDDGPRLVYADWLTERGDPWGEAIRLELELAPDGPPRPRLAARLLDLQAHRARFGLPDDTVFARGFPSFVRLTHAHRDLLESWAWPPLGQVGIHARFAESARSFLASRGLSNAHGFAYSAADGVDVGGVIMGHPWVRGLRKLSLYPGSFDVVSELAATPFERLESLTLWSSTLAPALVTSPHMSRLRVLEVSRAAADSVVLERLLAVRWPLEELNLDNVPLEARHFSVLADRAPLRKLNADRTGLDDAAIERLARGSLATARSLHLADGKLGAHGAAQLAGLPLLRDLDLQRNHIGDAGVAALVEGGKALRHLKLASTGFTATGLRALATLPAGLSTLDLSGVRYDANADGAFEALCAGPMIAQLTSLNLEGSYLGDRAVMMLAALPSSELRSLNLSYVGVSREGLEKLVRSPAMSRLTTLEVRSSGLTGKDAPLAWELPSLRHLEMGKGAPKKRPS